MNKHAQFFADPAERHYDSAIKILKYLNATKELGLHLGERKDLDIRLFADADFASDEESRHSISGNLIYVGNSLILSWMSEKAEIDSDKLNGSRVFISFLQFERYAVCRTTIEMHFSDNFVEYSFLSGQSIDDSFDQKRIFKGQIETF